MPNNQGVILWPSATLTNSNGYDKRFTQIAVGVFTDLHTVTFVYAYRFRCTAADPKQLSHDPAYSPPRRRQGDRPNTGECDSGVAEAKIERE
jgi:hypothetical protein